MVTYNTQNAKSQLEIQTMITAPDAIGWLDMPVSTLFSLDKEQLEAMQVGFACDRLNSLVTRIPALTALVEKQDIHTVDDLNDLAPLLFTHQMYKSYPKSLIETKKWDLLVKWLSKLTTHDLSDVDMSGVKSIDDWLERLETCTPMWLFHSTGTSGTLSFFPRSYTEKPAWIKGNYKFLETMIPDIMGLHLPVFWPAYRGGRQAGMRLIEYFGPELAGSPDEYHSLFNTSMSADLMSIAGRLRRAKEKNDLTAIEMIKAVLKTRGELLTLQTQRARLTKEFFEKMVTGYRGRRVFLMASAVDLFHIAEEGLSNGVKSVFAPDSVFLTGGGFKGEKYVANWKEILQEFYGVEKVHMCYGMTELNTYNPGCSAGHYHPLPWTIPFVLDQEGKVLPREGIQTGRAGYFDLLAETYWGGILTGDRVTVHFDDECPCGWKGPHIEDNVMRFTELMAGEDIISCSGVAGAQNEVIDLISSPL